MTSVIKAVLDYVALQKIHAQLEEGIIKQCLIVQNEGSRKVQLVRIPYILPLMEKIPHATLSFLGFLILLCRS